MDYLVPCMLFVWASYLWDTYLEWRQRRMYRTCKTVPVELTAVLDQKKFDKSRVYQLDKSSFSFLHGFFKQVEFLVIILVGGIPFIWGVAGSVLDYFNLSRDYEVVQSVVFLLLFMTYSTITESPWAIYSIFVLEEKHGFNKQTWGFFVKDQIKKFLLSCVLNSLISAGLIAIIKWGGEYFYIYAWLFILCVSLVMIFIYHDFIAPWFDKFSPLPEGDLRVAIEKLATSLSFPLKKLLVVEGSKRSAHSNAYFYGFWKNKYIVLFDTLLMEGVMKTDKPKEEEGAGESEGGENKEKEAGEKAEEKGDDTTTKEEEGGSEKKEEEEEEEGDGEKKKEEVGGDTEKEEEEGDTEKEEGDSEKKEEEGDGEKKEEEGDGEKKDDEGDDEKKKKKKGCTTSEILGVLAHELGHWKLSHNLQMLAISELNLLLLLFLFGYFMNQEDMYISFGFQDSTPILIGLILFLQLVLGPYNEVVSFLTTQLVRRFEYQADAFAVSLGHAGPLSSALVTLHQDNLGFPVADHLYSAFHHSHPTLLERLRALKTKTD